jgi:hypothetical protein
LPTFAKNASTASAFVLANTAALTDLPILVAASASFVALCEAMSIRRRGQQMHVP